MPAPTFCPDCTLCPRLASFLVKTARQYPDYHCKPVAPFGDAAPTLLIVGLAPGMHGANRTGRPFTGDYAGILLYDVGSSRVDLQACKLEYSIVSPK